jgi:hypothetical protein
MPRSAFKTVRFFETLQRFPQSHSRLAVAARTNVRRILPVIRFDRWRGSCASASEHHVLKSTVVALVLTVAIGPTVPPLCRAWCHPPDASTACHHEDASGPSRVAHRDCASVVLMAAAVVREDVRRCASDATTPHAVMAEASPFGTSGASRGHLPGRISSFGRRPIGHQLRI